MEIKVGEYVRTEDGRIGKLIESQVYEMENGQYIEFLEDIKVHSKNIIDLIEVGDFVNGSKVLDVMEDMETGEVHLEMTMNYTNEELGDCTIYNKDIETVVTKEQFESASYKVKE